MLKNCACCPETFEAQRSTALYCSGACRKWASVHPGTQRVARVPAVPKIKLLPRKCDTCADLFQPFSRSNRFCGRRCREWMHSYPEEQMPLAWKNGARRKKHHFVPRPCPQCGTEFLPRVSSGKEGVTRTCSVVCGNRMRAGMVPGERGVGRNYLRQDLERSKPGLSRGERQQLLWKWMADGRPCGYCPALATTVDHVRPLHLDGTNHVDNLVPCCRPCNTAKGRWTVEEWMRRGGPMRGGWKGVPGKAGVGEVLF